MTTTDREPIVRLVETPAPGPALGLYGARVHPAPIDRSALAAAGAEVVVEARRRIANLQAVLETLQSVLASV